MKTRKAHFRNKAFSSFRLQSEIRRNIILKGYPTHIPQTKGNSIFLHCFIWTRYLIILPWWHNNMRFRSLILLMQWTDERARLYTNSISTFSRKSLTYFFVQSQSVYWYTTHNTCTQPPSWIQLWKRKNPTYIGNWFWF